jgi:hypothetical protein
MASINHLDGFCHIMDRFSQCSHTLWNMWYTNTFASPWFGRKIKSLKLLHNERACGAFNEFYSWVASSIPYIIPMPQRPFNFAIVKSSHLSPHNVVTTQDRVIPYYAPNSSIKHSKSDSKDRSQEIMWSVKQV